VTDLDSTVQVWNPAAERLYGWTADEVIGRPLPAIPPERRDEYLRNVAQIAQGLPVSGFEGLNLRRDGAFRARVWAVPLVDPVGTVRCLTIVQDVTEQHRDRELRSQLAAIVESSEDAIIGKTLDAIVISWNSGAERLYGYTAEEVIGRPISLLIPSDRPDELPAIMERLRRGQRIEHYETRRVRKDGVVLDISVSISPIRDTSGQVVGAAAIARDITARRQAETERQDLLAREQSARARAERAVDRTTRLQMVTEALAKALTIEEVADVVMERGLPGARAVAGVVALRSEDGMTVDAVTAVGYPPSLVDTMRHIPVDGATPLAEAVRTGQPIWRDAGLVNSPRFTDFTEHAPSYPTGVALPLIVDGEAMGAIGMSFHDLRTFADDDRGFMLTLAGQCAQAILRVRLYEHERAGRDQLRAILDGVADGVLVQREDGSFLYANDTAAQMAGFESADDYLAANTWEISARLVVLDVEGQPFPHENLPARRAFRGELAPEAVVQYRRLDTGEARWARTQARTIRGPNGERLAISIFHDMTDEIRSRDRLRFLAEAGAQLAGSLDVEGTLEGLVRIASTTLADWAVVILIDEDGAVEQIATAHRNSEKEPLTRALHERQLRHASGAALLWQSIQTGEPMLVPVVSDEMLAATARDAEHLALLRALGLSSLLYAPLVGRGRVQGALALFMAESQRRFAEEDQAIAVEIARRASLALENARLYREARDAVHARDEFLSIASHELRTPVTAISGVAQLALRSQQRGTLDEARLTRVLDQITRSSQRLVTLTEDLLDVSRLQTGHIDLRTERVDVQAFVADVIDRYRANLVEQHQVTLHTDGRDYAVLGDPARLEQVLANLLSNAVKYSPAGGPITVSVGPGDASLGPSVQITVQDEGIGLPAEMRETIFEPFGRAANATHRQIQGLGLGLFISQQIVERHGGRIWAESPGVDQGTTMGLWLPLASE
jgi:PAS domain S-box-containing protein